MVLEEVGIGRMGVLCRDHSLGTPMTEQFGGRKKEYQVVKFGPRVLVPCVLSSSEVEVLQGWLVHRDIQNCGYTPCPHLGMKQSERQREDRKEPIAF